MAPYRRGRPPSPFYSPDALALQESFFGHYLKGDDTGWEQQPPVRIAIRAADGARWRDADSWPLPNTAWTDVYLDASTSVLRHGTPTDEATVEYDAPEGKVTFTWPLAAQETEITGPVALRLWVSSTTSDMDVYVTLRQQAAAGGERFSIGPGGQPGPLAQGWLRVSHRALDTARSLPYRPFHSHDREEPLGLGDVLPIDIEVWPTSIVLAAGDTLLLDLSSSDQDVPFRMDTDPDGRPAERFDGVNTTHTGPDHPSFLRLPTIAGDHS